jgi:hypothetical protein
MIRASSRIILSIPNHGYVCVTPKARTPNLNSHESIKWKFEAHARAHAQIPDSNPSGK